MAILGINLLEVTGRRSKVEGKVRIKEVSTNMKITDVKLRKVANTEMVAFGFEFVTKFTTDEGKKFGELKVIGEMLYSNSSKKLKEVVKKWEKEKKVEPEILQEVLQAVSDNCLVEIAYLARKIGLPIKLLPLRFPIVEVRKGKEGVAK